MNYKRIVFDTVKQRTINTNQYADAIRDINRLKETANRLNQENCSLKKILSDILPMVEEYEFSNLCNTKYSDLIKSLVH